MEKKKSPLALKVQTIWRKGDNNIRRIGYLILTP